MGSITLSELFNLSEPQLVLTPKGGKDYLLLRVVGRIK